MSTGKTIILIKKQNFDTASSRTSTLAWINGLHNKGYDIQLFTTYSKYRENFGLDAVEFISIPKTPILRTLVFYLKLWLKLQPIFLSQQADVVILDKHTFFLGFPFDILGKWGIRKRTKVIVDFRDDIVFHTQSVLKNIAARVLNFFGPAYAALMTNGISASTQAGIDSRNFKNFIFPKNEAALHSGVDPNLFDPNLTSPVKLPHIQDDQLALIFHGSISPIRGLLELLEGIHLTKNKHRLHLVVVGSGEYAATLKKRSKALNLKNQVTWIDSVTHSSVPGYIAACQIGVLPYPDITMWQMSSPIKLMEYLSMGKAVLLSDFKVYREVTRDLEHIYYLKDNQPETIAAMLDNLVDAAGSIPWFIPAHRTRAVDQYSWDSQIDKLDLYIKTVRGY